MLLNGRIKMRNNSFLRIGKIFLLQNALSLDFVFEQLQTKH
jgi:hypothetical protein